MTRKYSNTNIGNNQIVLEYEYPEHSTRLHMYLLNQSRDQNKGAVTQQHVPGHRQ